MKSVGSSLNDEYQEDEQGEEGAVHFKYHQLLYLIHPNQFIAKTFPMKLSNFDCISILLDKIDLSLILSLKQQSILIINKFKFIMNKVKQYNKLILDRLNKKQDQSAKNSHLNSSQKTMATSNDSTNTVKIQQIKHFFDNFNKNCAVYHQPVVLRNKKPMKRVLFLDFSVIDMKKIQSKQTMEKRQKMVTQPSSFTQYPSQEYKRQVRQPVRLQYDNRSNLNLKKQEQRVLSNCKIIQPVNYIQRYKSLKTMPCGPIINQNNNCRRVLVYPPTTKAIADPRDYKMQKRKSPLKKGIRKCQSYQKYFEERRFL